VSIWEKILSGVANLSIGGPIGALLDTVTGATTAETAQGAPKTEDDNTKKLAFTTGCIVLGAKMAKADGLVTRDEVAAFKEVFEVSPEEMKNVGRLFDQARKDANGYEPYARQIARLFHNKSEVLEKLLAALFHIAKADGKVTPDEEDYLEHVAALFGFSSEDFARIRAIHMAGEQGDPYQQLGLSPEADTESLKAAYRRLVRDNHPDKLMAEGLPPEFIAVANEKLKVINAAWTKIRQDRGIT